MSRLPLSVGLDYHSDSIQVAVVDESGSEVRSRSVPNDVDAVMAVIGPQPVKAVAIESCTGAACLADDLVDRHGLTVFLAHTGYVHKMRQSPDKSDYTDARVLADLVRVGYLPRVWHAPREIRQLRRLVRYRQFLVRQRRAVKQRIGAVLRDERIQAPACRRWTLRWLLWLEQEATLSDEGRWTVMEMLDELRYLDHKVERSEDRLRARVADDAIVTKLMQIKGIGLVIACTLRAEIGRFDRFRTGKQLSNFCGLSPRNASSGRRMADAGLLKQANRELRAVILQGAHLLKRYHPRWSQLAEEMKARGKHGSVIVAAIANRWMRGLHHEMSSMGLAA